MSVRLKIDHDKKLVEVVLDKETSAAEAERFFDEFEAADAVSYRKLIDATTATPMIDDKVMSIVSSRIARYQNPGPVAVVVQGAYFDGLAKLFLLAVDVARRTRVFRTVAEARDWLDELAREDAAASQ